MGAMIFTNLTNNLVIFPIESMIEKVHNITKDPLKAAHEEEKKLLKAQLADQDSDMEMDMSQQKKNELEKKKNKNIVKPMETEKLEKTLGKIGSLLALVFGEAGAEIIAQNMDMGGENDVDPMLPGQKGIFIFGFCDIRNFTDCTEVLEEGVMLFVNEIGEIVHSTVAHYSGAANKNVGDAFLLVWKLEKQDQAIDTMGEIHAIKGLRVSQLADMAVISFVTLISTLKRNRKLLKYKMHKGLNERLPGYEVKLGLGMHLGYAIEGAIGSYYKIDASYLSMNVSMSERLEGATKKYGVPLLISGDLWDYLSHETQVQCRQVDYVNMAGMKDPVKLFTIDVDPEAMEFDPEVVELSLMQQKFERIK